MWLLCKDTVKKIGKTFGRFLSILCIVGLGLGFFAGIRHTSNDMLFTLDSYFDDTHLYDVKLVSDLGITDDEIKYLRDTITTSSVIPAYSEDVIVEDTVLRIHSIYSTDWLILEEGRYPTKGSECLAEAGKYAIGDKVSFDDSKLLNISSCEVVGTIYSSLYIGKEKGNTSIGNGKIASYLYVLEDAFSSKYYTEVYFLGNETKDLLSYSDAYENVIVLLKKELEGEFPKLSSIRYQLLYDELVLQLESQGIPIIDTVVQEQIPHPKYYLFDRNDLSGYSDFYNDALRVDSIASVFPMFFLLVAALVCLNTMVRFVEEERTQFGILKSLGYSNFKIIFGFILYVSVATLIGGLFGLIIGYQLLPRVIYGIYRFSYTLPDIIISVPLGTSIILIGVALFLVNAVTVYACSYSLLEQPAFLLRPKVMSKGKNIWLERIPFLWKRLIFTNKVTLRNMFRYKKRFFMTVLGIAGCMGLLVTGFGLKDSIGGIVEKQFSRVFSYDSVVVFREAVQEIPDDVNDVFLEYTDGKYALVSQESYTFEANHKVHDVTLMAPADWDALLPFVHFYDHKTKKPLSMPEDGVIVNEKMAKLLGVDVGDSVSVYDLSHQKYTVRVVGIMEQYAGHYMFLTNDYYQRVFGRISYSMMFHNLSGDGDLFSKAMLEKEEVLNVTLMDDVQDNFVVMIDSLNQIVWVILGAACLLAFVVLYNLTIINITERKREIATLKVLGFYDREVSNYVYKEVTLLMLIGIVIGGFLGIVLHRFVMETASMDTVLFPIRIEWISYVYSAGFTILFTIFTFMITNRHLKNIDMATSLKSVE